MFRKTVFLCLFTLVAVFAFADNDWNIKVNGRVTEDNSKLEGAVVSLIKNSRLMQEVITAGNGKFVFVLRPGNDYLIEVSKPGYESKSIAFSTKNVPVEDIGAGFPEFPIEIRMFQEIDGVNMEVLSEPVGKIIYSAITDDFAIDMEYHRSIKAELVQLSKDIKAAQAGIAQGEYAEERELASSERDLLSTPNGESDNSIIPEIVVEANSHVREESVQASDRQGVEISTGLELLDLQRERIRQELEHLPALLVSVKTYKEGEKEILIRIVKQTDVLIEYKRVIQPWGSRFYFKEGTSISEHIFQLESDVEALLQPKLYMF